MRFVRALAAVAALVCSAVAGQAGAATYFNLQADPSQSPITSISILDGYDSLPNHTIFPVNMGHWVDNVVIDPRYRISGIYSVKTAQADSLSMRLFKYKAPLSERFTFISFDFAPGTFSKLGTFQTIGAYTAEATIAWNPGPRVPEPATWALLILGFGATGQALRIRRRRAAAITA